MGNGEGMSENLKIMIAVAIIGGTNAGQLLGITIPGRNTVVETTANNEQMRDDLSLCMADLRTCYQECSHVSMDHSTVETEPKGFTPERWAQANENLNALAPPDAQKFIEAPDNWAWAAEYE